MVLKQYALTGLWVWATEDNYELSPQFFTKAAAQVWKKKITKLMQDELNEKQPEPVGEECTCDNCGCN